MIQCDLRFFPSILAVKIRHEYTRVRLSALRRMFPVLHNKHDAGLKKRSIHISSWSRRGPTGDLHQLDDAVLHISPWSKRYKSDGGLASV
jgi:hypothetical protein